MARLYVPFDHPVAFGHHTPEGTVDYTLPANADVELPDDVADRVLARHAQAGVVVLTGNPVVDAQEREKAEERYTRHLKWLATMRVGTLYGAGSFTPQSDHEVRLHASLKKRGLVSAEPEPEEEKPSPKSEKGPVTRPARGR